MSARETWRLESARVRDLLGLRGEQSFHFEPGLQVLEAPNHTGKSSLALALLWGLTGSVPKLARLNLVTFRMTNRHAGRAARPEVEIALASDAGRRLALRRAYSARPREGLELAVRLDDREVRGAAAAELLQRELGLGSAGLEGAGVVLQDQRNALVTGKEAALSAVVNEVLGLEALSEVAPALRAAAKEAERFASDVVQFKEGDDPVRRWEQEERRLAAAFEAAEARARGAGLGAAELEDPAAWVEGELGELSEALGSPSTDDEPRARLELLRGALRAQRSSSPLSRRAADLEARQRAARKRRLDWSAEAARLGELAPRRGDRTGERARLEAERAAALARLAALAERRADSKSETALLEAAWEHLRSHREDPACPVCRAVHAPGSLLAELEERLGRARAASLEELERAERAARAERDEAHKRLELFERCEQAERAFAAELARSAEHAGAGELARAAGAFEPGREDAFGALERALAEVAREAEDEEARCTAEEERSRAQWQRQEAEVFQPLEVRLERLGEVLLPLVDAAHEIERHGARRGEARDRAGELEVLAREARAFAGDLKAVAEALALEEQERASRAVRAAEPFMSDFFAQVAQNPDYTGLAFEAEVARGQVTYRLRATSKKSPDLEDVASHVLSSADRSAASAALLLGLANGAAHGVGFLVLDDPAQGMDPALQRAFARQLARRAGVAAQVVVLTHQAEFAAALAEHGALRRDLFAGPAGVETLEPA